MDLKSEFSILTQRHKSNDLSPRKIIHDSISIDSISPLKASKNPMLMTPFDSNSLSLPSFSPKPIRNSMGSRSKKKDKISPLSGDVMLRRDEIQRSKKRNSLQMNSILNKSSGEEKGETQRSNRDKKEPKKEIISLSSKSPSFSSRNSSYSGLRPPKNTSKRENSSMKVESVGLEANGEGKYFSLSNPVNLQSDQSLREIRQSQKLDINNLRESSGRASQPKARQSSTKGSLNNPQQAPILQNHIPQKKLKKKGLKELDYLEYHAFPMYVTALRPHYNYPKVRLFVRPLLGESVEYRIVNETVYAVARILNDGYHDRKICSMKEEIVKRTNLNVSL